MSRIPSPDSSSGELPDSMEDINPRSRKRRRTSQELISDNQTDSDTGATTEQGDYGEYYAPSRIQNQLSNAGTTTDLLSLLSPVAAQPSKPTTASSFTSIPLSPWLHNTLRTLSITNPTPIQLSTIPSILKGSDVLASSPTGTGKTLAFALPILHAWSADPFGIYAVILTPTRELALQIYEQFSALGAAQDLKVVLVTGGSDMRPQAIALGKRPHVVVATPGRLADHIRQSGEDTVRGLKRVKVVVLDEADRLLDRQARMLDDLGTCLSTLPARTERQTLCFTATMTEEVRALKNMTQSSSDHTKRKVFICELSPEQIASSTTTTSSSSSKAAGITIADQRIASHDSPTTTGGGNDPKPSNPIIPPLLRQTFLTAPSPQKPAYLHVLLTLPSLGTMQTMVFTNRTSTADLLFRTLLLLGHPVTALHSRLAQSRRSRNLSDFRARKARVLICTDVGGRGLDIHGVGLVVNYDVPRDPDDYVHRVGRTARAGRPGLSLTLVGARDVELVLAIERRVGGGGGGGIGGGGGGGGDQANKEEIHDDDDADANAKWKMEEWSEPGVNVETRVVKDGAKVLKEVGLARMEALRQMEAGRDEKGRLRKIRKVR